jgi:hypothetical protein
MIVRAFAPVTLTRTFWRACVIALERTLPRRAIRRLHDLASEPLRPTAMTLSDWPSDCSKVLCLYPRQSTCWGAHSSLHSSDDNEPDLGTLKTATFPSRGAP